MRILLTVHQFLPDHASGTEILTLHTAQELQRRGHQVTIFTGYPAKTHLRDDQRFDHYEFEGLTIHRFYHALVPMAGQTNLVQMEYCNWLFASHFRQFLRTHPQDIAHFFHLARLSGTAVAICSQHRLPMVFTPTDFWAICPLINLRLPNGDLCDGPDPFASNCVRHVAEVTQHANVGHKLALLPDAALAAGVLAIAQQVLPERWFSPFVRGLAERPDYLRQRLNQIERILAPTRLMQSMLARNGVHRAQLRYVPYGVELDHIQRDTHKGAREKIRIGFIGTLSEHKGAHILIQAFRKLPPGLPVELYVYGNPNEFPAFTQHLQALAAGDPRITLAGTFANNLIGAVFSQLDALVVPSIWYENTPLVIYSAQAAGCPVIATNLGGMAEVIKHGVNGLLFEKADIPGLTRCLRTLATDRPLLHRLAQATTIPKSIAQYAEDCLENYAQIFAARGILPSTTVPSP